MSAAGQVARWLLEAAAAGVGWLLWLLTGLIMGLLLIAASLWWWSGTEHSLVWAWHHLAQTRGWEAQDLRGSLRTGLKARHVRWQHPQGGRVELETVDIAWVPAAWLERRVQITHLRISSLRLTPASSGSVPSDAQPLVLPAWPVEVQIDAIAIERLGWRAPPHGQASALEGGYRYQPQGSRHTLELQHLSLAQGRYSGQVQLWGPAPMALQAQLRGAVKTPALAGRPGLQLDLQAQAQGHLDDFTLTARLQGRGGAAQADAPQARVSARLRPGQPLALDQVQVQLQQIDAAWFWPAAPRTRLHGQLALETRGPGGWRLNAQLTNAQAGPWDRQGLPLSRLEIQGDWREGNLQVQHLRAQVGPPIQGAAQPTHLEVSGQWSAAKAWQLSTRLQGVRLADLHSAGGAHRVDGWLRAQGQGSAADFDLNLRAMPPPVMAAVGWALDTLRAQGSVNPSGLTLQHLRATALDGRRTGAVWSLQLQAPVTLMRQADATWQLAAGQALLQAPAASGGGPAQLAWDPLDLQKKHAVGSGRITDLPLAWIRPAGLPPGNDLVLQGQWHLAQSPRWRVQAQLTRARGDLSLLAEDAQGRPVRMAAGVREASLALDIDGPDMALNLLWHSERAGTVSARLSSRLESAGPEGWHWPPDAALTGQVRVQMPRLAVWSWLAPPGWRVRGSLNAELTLTGTRRAPQMTGPVQIDDLGLRSVVDGVALERGQLRAHLQGRRLWLDQLRWYGPGEDGGQVVADGTIDGISPQAGLQVNLQARLDRLRAITRSDRQLTLSGTAAVQLDPHQAQLHAKLQVDRARITLTDQAPPDLGSDVVVRSAGPNEKQTASPAWAPAVSPGGWPGRPVVIDAAIDLGTDFLVTGRGVETGLRGRLQLGGQSLVQPQAQGRLETVNGRYSAYGQQLEITRGVLRFDGRLDDPLLDLIALRPHPQGQVGVQVSGRGQAPVVRLWSQQPMTEAEKLAGLVLGQAEPGGAIRVGRQIGRHLYAAYERSLAGAVGTLYMVYQLTEHLTLRAQTGDRTGLDLIYSISLDPAAPGPRRLPP